MKLNANALAIAAATTTAVLWILCSLIVVLLPEMSMNMSGYMMHTDFADMQWSMNVTGFIVGLIVWSLFVGVAAWLLSVFYNKFS